MLANKKLLTEGYVFITHFNEAYIRLNLTLGKILLFKDYGCFFVGAYVSDKIKCPYDLKKYYPLNISDLKYIFREYPKIWFHSAELTYDQIDNFIYFVKQFF